MTNEDKIRLLKRGYKMDEEILPQFSYKGLEQYRKIKRIDSDLRRIDNEIDKLIMSEEFKDSKVLCDYLDLSAQFIEDALTMLSIGYRRCDKLNKHHNRTINEFEED